MSGGRRRRRKIEVFTAGCPCCTEAVELVEFLAGTEHDVEIRDMHDPAVVAAAAGYGIRRLPAVVIDGRLTDNCAALGLDEETLTQAIVGPTRRPGNRALHRRRRGRVTGSHFGGRSCR